MNGGDRACLHENRVFFLAFVKYLYAQIVESRVENRAERKEDIDKRLMEFILLLLCCFSPRKYLSGRHMRFSLRKSQRHSWFLLWSLTTFHPTLIVSISLSLNTAKILLHWGRNSSLPVYKRNHLKLTIFYYKQHFFFYIKLRSWILC